MQLFINSYKTSERVLETKEIIRGNLLSPVHEILFVSSSSRKYSRHFEIETKLFKLGLCVRDISHGFKIMTRN